MRKLILWVCWSLVIIVAIASCNSTPQTSGSSNIIIAGKNFTEQDVLGELLAQQIEDTTNLKVDFRPRLGGSFVCHNALISGKIDGYVEYTGTAFVAILQEKVINDPKIVYEKLKQLYNQKFQLEVMPSLGFENTNAMVIRGEDARSYNITTISESAQHTPKWRAGFGYEFLEREDGYSGFAKVYGLRFAKPPQIMDLGLIYRAILQKQVDFIVAFSTDGQLSRFDLVALKDDKKYFPPYEPVPIFRQETLKKYPQLRQAIEQIVGQISTDEIQNLNYLVEGELRDVKEVVREFRKFKGWAKATN